MPETIVTETAALWGAALQAAGCPKCGVAHLVPAERLNASCPNCLAAKLTPQPARLHSAPPELYLPFALTSAQVQNALANWARGIWLQPDDLKPQTLLSRLTKTYLPLWLVDGQVIGSWQAQVGYDYQVASSQESYASGQWQTHKVTETRIRWEPRAGLVDRAYQNVVAPALEEHERLMAQLGQYPINQATAYSPAALKEAAVRAPSLLPDAAWPIARAGLDHHAADDCQTAAAAQHIDQFKLQAEYQNHHWTQLLLPIYTTAYRDDEGRVIPILINGHTGKVAGKLRSSPKKGWLWTGAITALALAGFVFAVLITLAGAVFPPLVLVGGLLILLSLGLGLIAPVPAIYVWRKNR